jgi:hypothetical protein
MNRGRRIDLWNRLSCSLGSVMGSRCFWMSMAGVRDGPVARSFLNRRV